MSRFLRGIAEGEMPVTLPSTNAGAPEALTAFIDQGSEFEGKLSFKNTVRIDGSFKGEITSENTLIVGEPGVVLATIRSRQVIVSGEVTGDIIAGERLVLHKTARVEGDIQTPKLVVEDGAELHGNIKMGGGKARSNGQQKPLPTSQADAVN
jgi:cytoskeletal protein CcmA (bactofilin family)